MRWVLPWVDRGSESGLHSGGGRGGRRRLQALVALAATALVMLSAATAAQAIGTGSVEGTVTNHKAEDLKGIEVTVLETGGNEVGSTKTNSSGTFDVAGIAKGDYTVAFSDETATYLKKQVRAVSVEEGEATKLPPVVLTKASAVDGQVTSASSPAGLSGASVYIEDRENPSNFEETTTEASGRYRFTQLEPGEYEMYFSYSGGEYLERTVTIVLGEGVEQTVPTVQLSEGGKISGTVTNAYTHAGLEKIRVSAYSPEHGGGTAETNTKGEYTISGLAGGVYDVEYSWEYNEAEDKEYEKAPAFIPKYITQYYNGQTSQGSANTVSVSEGNTTSGINVGMLPSAPHNLAAPAITGTALVGDVLTCSNGSWTGEGMLSVQSGWPLTTPFGYQWLLEGSAISGATSVSYLVQGADEGHSLACEVTATNAAGHEASKSGSVTVPVPAVVAFTQRLVFVKDTAKASIACANAVCTGTAEITARVGAKHGHKRTVVIAKGSYTLAAGTHGTVALRLTGRGAEAMLAARHRTLSGKLTISVKVGKTLTRPVVVALAKR
ncbi:MAG TPA: carboxypeptidase regulatory-like domain-containing protein [Solirubrobacteraceae bacterium]